MSHTSLWGLWPCDHPYFLCATTPPPGHLGQQKTLAHVKEKFWWSGMRADVYLYVSSCAICQARKVVTNPRPVPLQPTAPPNEPFEVVGIDHMGPFPRSKHGNKFLIVATDYLTKWVYIIRAVPDSASTHVMNVINECLIYRHGTPKLPSIQPSNWTIISNYAAGFTRLLHIF